MSKLIVDIIQPKDSQNLEIQGNINVSGRLNGMPITVLTGNTSFTGNTPSNPTSQMYVDYLYGCNGQLNIGTNTVIDGSLTATEFYGDGSNLTNLTVPTFTGNTSGNCVQDLWLEYLYGCDGNIIVNSDLNVVSVLSANTFSGDSSYMTKSLNDIIPVGSGIANVNAYLQYGLNIISNADTSNFCVRLPQTPIKGRQVDVINNSGFDIYVFPSVAGGSINGVVNGPSIIPSDGIKYNFICYENPAPGSWSGNFVQSTGQYDSGVISIDTSSSAGWSNNGQYVSAYDDNFKNRASGFWSSNAVLDGLNGPNIYYYPWSPTGPCSGSSSGFCQVVYFKPVIPWSFIDKVTVYTNFSTAVTYGGIFRMSYAIERAYYSAGTNSYIENDYSGGGSALGQPTSGYASQMMGGTASSNTYTLNPGEPGTWWGELVYSASTRPANIGTILLSSGTFNLPYPIGTVSADYWQTTAVAFIFDTNQNSANVKFRFLIDYTT
jgi:hypothetical protein